MKTCNAVVIAAFFIGAVLCQLEDLDLDNVKNQIPGLENFNQSALPQKEEVEKALREKCKKNGDESAFDDIVNSRDAVQSCLQTYVNQTVIMEELEVAKKDGSMDEVFGKYCRKRPEIMACVTDVLKKVEKCLEPEEKTSLQVLVNVVDKVGNFSCFKDGDRLALFVAESGLECLEQSKEGIQFCANQTFQSKVPKDLSITNLPLFTIGEKECSEMEKFQLCAVKEFEKCESNTPANVIEALFKFIRRETPCKNFDTAKPAATRWLSKRSDQVADDKGFAFIKSLDAKCTKYAGPNAYKDLEMSAQVLKKNIQDNLQLGCKGLIEVRNLSSPVINKLRVCLPPQESYIPTFAHSAIDSVLKYLCDNNGDNYKKVMRPDALTCLFSNNKAFGSCLDATKVKTADSNIVTKNELCEKLNTAKVCLSSYVTNHCSQIPDFKDVTVGIMESMKEPCSSGFLPQSNILHITIALIFVSCYKLFV